MHKHISVDIVDENFNSSYLYKLAHCNVRSSASIWSFFSVRSFLMSYLDSSLTRLKYSNILKTHSFCLLTSCYPNITNNFFNSIHPPKRGLSPKTQMTNRCTQHIIDTSHVGNCDVSNPSTTKKPQWRFTRRYLLFTVTKSLLMHLGQFTGPWNKVIFILWAPQTKW